MHPNRVVGKRADPPYAGPDLTKPTVTVGGRETVVPDLSWMLRNAPHAKSVRLDPARQPGVEAVLTVEGKHPVTGKFSFRTGFADRNGARSFVDRHMGHVQDRTNALRDGGY